MKPSRVGRYLKWSRGFLLLLAAVFLTACKPGPELIRAGSLTIEPPTVYNNAESVLVRFELLSEAPVHLELWSLNGKELWRGADTWLDWGQHTLTPDRQLWNRTPGAYTLRAVAWNPQGEDTEQCAFAVQDSTRE